MQVMTGESVWDSPRRVAVAASALAIAVKVLLVEAYSSTDLEVHRNWMAIVYHLPLRQWYTESTSEWTLDYPPFFAYFEKLLSIVAARMGLTDILRIQKEPLMNREVLLFQRFSVIACDFFLLFSLGVLSWRGGYFRRRVDAAVFSLLATHSIFFLLDHVHFQYNGFLTAFFILSVYYIEQGSYFKAAFFYSILLNLKHIYIYYAPGYIALYCLKVIRVKDPLRILRLALALGIPVIVSFGPFVLSSGIPGFQRILDRLFPIQRGLTHAYWAPNIYAIYNVVDLVLSKVIGGSQPEYTSGLVQEYDHIVLPCVGVLGSVSLLLVSLLPLFISVFFNRNPRPLFLLFFSSLCFFMCGYHVHEKAVLLLLVPVVVLAAQSAQFLPFLLDVTLVASSSLCPLLFTSQEIPLRSSFMIFQYLATLFFCVWVYGISWRDVVSPTKFAILFGVQFYQGVHGVLFGDRLPFLPLLLLSLVNALVMISVYARCLVVLFEAQIAEVSCRFYEWLYSNTSEEPVDDIEVIAGFDITRSKTDPFFAVVAATFYKYSTMELLAEVCVPCVLSSSYVPHSLAASESSPIMRVLRRAVAEDPSLRPNLILVDGNGLFHPRMFGLACHVACRSGIPCIGVAKNMDYAVVGGGMKKRVEEMIRKTPRAVGHSLFDVVSPCVMAIVSDGSAHPVFVSPSKGLPLDTAIQVVEHCFHHGVSPTNRADLVSREWMRRLE